MEFKILYEDEDVLVIDKPAGMIVDDIPKRVHRLDKDTSGILLIAKNDKTLEFLQRQFKERKIEKKYIALVIGNLEREQGTIETLIGRSPGDRRKQKVYLPPEPDSKGKREAVTKYKVLQRFSVAAKSYGGPAEAFGEGGQTYTLIEVELKTGRKHQIRTHFAYLGHPVAGDKLYGFKGQICPPGLKRQFLHANYLKTKLQNGQIKEFKSELPEDLKLCLQNLKPL